MTEPIDAVIDKLTAMRPLREPVLRSAIEALAPAAGSHGLDVGCGIGDQALQLAEAVGPGGRVTGLDISHSLLAQARRNIAGAPQAGSVSFTRGDMLHLPYADGRFDWAWSVDCAGYPAGGMLPVLKEMARVVRPGGRVAVLAWSSQQLLPGYAQLEARLNVTCSAYAPLLEGRPPAAQFLRALHWFPDAGLTEPAARTFVGQVQGPLTPAARAALASLFDMLWGNPSPAASREDLDAFRRLCTPGSPEFILNLPEYVGFFTYTLFAGTVA